VTELAGDISFALDHIEKGTGSTTWPTTMRDGIAEIASCFSKRLDQRMRDRGRSRKAGLAAGDPWTSSGSRASTIRWGGTRATSCSRCSRKRFVDVPRRPGPGWDGCSRSVRDRHSLCAQWQTKSRASSNKTQGMRWATGDARGSELRLSARVGIALYHPTTVPDADTLFQGTPKPRSSAPSGRRALPVLRRSR